MLSLFASESNLQIFDKIAHGSTAIAEQISFWWCIFRQIKSKELKYTCELLNAEQLIDDQFIELNLLNNYHQEFDLVFKQNFGTFPDASLKYYSRYFSFTSWEACLFFSIFQI